MTLPNFKDYFQLHFIVFIWGFTAILGELVTTISRFELVFYRTLIATIGIYAIFLYQKRSFQADKKEIVKYLLTGALISIHWILFFIAMHISTVSICLIGLATSSLWTSILEPLFYKRKLQWLNIGLGLVIMVGLYIVSASEIRYALGLVLGVLSALFGALFGIFNSQFIKKQNHYTITLYEMVGAFLASALFLPFYWFYPGANNEIHLNPTMSEWICIGILAIICTVYAFAVSVKLMKKFTAFAVNLTVNMEPIYGIILAFFIFPEKERQLSDNFYIGAVIILITVLSYPALDKLFHQRKNNVQEIEQLKTVNS